MEARVAGLARYRIEIERICIRAVHEVLRVAQVSEALEVWQQRADVTRSRRSHGARPAA